MIVDRTGGLSWAFAVAAAAPLIAMVAWGLIIRRVAPPEWTLAPVSAPSLRLQTRGTPLDVPFADRIGSCGLHRP